MKAPTSEKDVSILTYDGDIDGDSIDSIVKNNIEYDLKNKELLTYIAKIKATKHDLYSNINNINRPRIIWTARNLNLYKDFSTENGHLKLVTILPLAVATMLGLLIMRRLASQ